MEKDRITLSEIKERENMRKQAKDFLDRVGGARTEKKILLVQNLALIYNPARINMDNDDISKEDRQDAYNVVQGISSALALLAENETTVDEVAKIYKVDLSEAKIPTIRGTSVRN